MILFCNIPLIENHDGVIYTGPVAGSCWSHCVPGLYSYVPFPFFMANATSYLKAHGIECEMFDAWAHRITDYEAVKNKIRRYAPDMLVLETATPAIAQVLAMAKWAKELLGCKVVLTGPHVAAYADDLLANSFVDHVVAGEYDLACLKIAQGDARRKIAHEMVRDVDMVNGQPWHPYRDPTVLRNYLDPSMYAGGFQVQVNDARGCPGFACTFCAWPEVMYEHKYRARKAATVLHELREVKAKYPVASWFFDSETWNGGRKDRLVEMCVGLKEIGTPWTFMGRTDQSSREEFEMFHDAGCVGCRLAPETFHQRLLDKVNKRLDAKTSWETCEWIAHRFPGFHVRFLTMYNMPGETKAEEDGDMEKFEQLQEIGRRNGVRVDIQRASCVPMPGTKLWRELQAAGEGEKLRDFQEFQPINGTLGARLNLTVKGAAVNA